MQMRTTAFILALLAFPAGALATPLDQPTCDTLKIERDTLVAAGLETEMARGPEWAKTNLPPDRLKQIARMIEVDEQLSFRCGELATARPTLKEPKPVEAAAVPGKKEAATAPAGQSATASTGDEAPVKKKKKTASQKKAKSKDAAASPPTAGAGSALSP